MKTCLLLIFTALTLSACSLNVTSEAFAAKARAKKEVKLVEQGLTHIQNHYLLAPSTNLFFLTTAKQVPEQASEKITAQLKNGLQSTQLFKQFFGPENAEQKLLEDRALKIQAEIYFDSLGAVAVSDRDIANPLGNYLQVGSFLVGQVSLWPCANCDNQSMLRLKLRLIDIESGDILWTCSVERELFGFEMAQIEPIALEMADQLVILFDNRFRTKWHRSRYENLKG